jgi:SAM-dependent methyltransferase
LDIGCGAGTVDFYLANKGYDVTGIDISSRAISSCQKTAKNLGLKNTNFIEVDFPKKSLPERFDFIICSEIIEHLDDDQLAFKQINKLLKPKGLLIVTTPSKNAPLYRWGLTNKFDQRVGHLRRYDPNSLSKEIKNHGFKIVKIEITEGIIRNFLFTNSIAGKFVRFVKYFVSDIVTHLDNVSTAVFGGSDIIIVARKI